MKNIFTLVFLVLFLSVQSQTVLKDEDFNGLVKISELYGRLNGPPDTSFYMQLEQARTPVLGNMINVIELICRHDSMLLDTRVLIKPIQKELYMWYAFTAIDNNVRHPQNPPKKNNDIAKNIISTNIDTKWLLDNYYFRLRDGWVYIFNYKDLSSYNFEFEKYNLKSRTDKAIFFLNMIDAFGGRMVALRTQKDYNKIIEYAGHMPKFYGQEYYNYIDLNIEDFKWPRYDVPESYGERRIADFYNILLAHLAALDKTRNKNTWSNVYFNSICYVPDLFKYAYLPKELKDMYASHPNPGRRKKK